MNLNEQYSQPQRPGLGRKLIKRPMETPGLESNPSMPTMYPGFGSTPFSQSYDTSSFQSHNPAYSSSNNQSVNINPYGLPNTNFGVNIPASSAAAAIFSDPLVKNVAMQYGHALVGSGREMVDKEISKYVPISKIKYYFAVDTSYVYKKLSIILFPYLHSDWSIRYDQNEPIQPKFEVNAPDLYIPTMAFLTYILVVGLIFGTKSQFTPEKLSIEATNAIAWTFLEVVIQLITLYIANISTNLKTLDLISYSSYKYVGVILTILVNLLLGHVGYMTCVSYVSISITFFLMRALKLQVLSEPTGSQPDMYGMQQQPSFHQVGLKRRRYFLLFVSCTQPIFIWWFTWRLL